MSNNCKHPEMCLLSETCVPCAICPNAKEKADDRLALTPCSAMGWSRKTQHKNLGEVTINMECLAMQIQNCDPTTIFVEHDGDIKEVSRSMIIPLLNA